MNGNPQQIELPFPIKGYDENWAYGRQPEGTSPYALNVTPYDPIASRLRGGQRWGLSKFSATQVAGNYPIQNILQVSTATLPTDIYDGRAVTFRTRTFYARDSDLAAIASLFLGTSNYPGDPGRVCYDADGNIYGGGGTTKATATYPNCTLAKCTPTLSGVTWTLQLQHIDYPTDWGYLDDVDYNYKQNLLVAASGLSTSWAGAAGNKANIWLVDPATGAIKWHFDITNVTGYNQTIWRVQLDDNGYVWAFTYRTNIWDNQTNHGSTYANVFKIKPDLTSSGPTNDATTSITAWDTGANNLSANGCDYRGQFILTIENGTVKFRSATDFSVLKTCSTGGDQGRILSNNDVVFYKTAGVGNQYVYYWDTSGATATSIFIYATTTTKPAWIEVDANDNIFVGGMRSNTWTGSGGAYADIFKLNIAGTVLKHGDTNTTASVYGGACYIKPPTSAIRVTELYAVSNGSIYKVSSSGATLVTGGENALYATYLPVTAVYAYGHVFWIDGAHSVDYDMSTSTATSWTATAGTLPSEARIMALYRGRIVLAGFKNDPHNWYMSTAGNPLDWDYGATPSATMAVAGNDCNAGACPDIITCLAPFNDDLMVIGGDHTLWVLRGDPADNGRIDNISNHTGIAGPRAYTLDPNGVMYFFGSGTLWRLAPTGIPEPISRNRLDRTFKNIDLSSYDVRLVWDSIRHGLHIFLVPSESKTIIQYYWDQRADSFWPVQYPNDCGPSAACIYDADDPDDRTILLGGFDGYIRQLDNSAKTDDDETINSYIKYTPVSATGWDQNMLLNRLVAVLDDSSDEVILSIFSDETPQKAVTSSTVRWNKSLTAGRNVAITRLAGNTFVFQLSNSTNNHIWALEALLATIMPRGRVRKGLL